MNFTLLKKHFNIINKLIFMLKYYIYVIFYKLKKEVFSNYKIVNIMLK
jgi:hypothetical protein